MRESREEVMKTRDWEDKIKEERKEEEKECGGKEKGR